MTVETQITVSGLRKPWNCQEKGHPTNLNKSDLLNYTLKLIKEDDKYHLTCNFLFHELTLGVFENRYDALAAMKQCMKHAMQGKLYHLVQPAKRLEPQSPASPSTPTFDPRDLCQEISEDEIFDLTPLDD